MTNKKLGNVLVDMEIKVNGKVLTKDEVNFLQEIIETQKIEVESLTDEARENKSTKKTFDIIDSLAQKFSTIPNFV